MQSRHGSYASELTRDARHDARVVATLEAIGVLHGFTGVSAHGG